MLGICTGAFFALLLLCLVIAFLLCAALSYVLGADLRSVPYAVLLWLTPICYALTKRFFYPGRKNI